MRAFDDLPVARKLGLSAALAMLLLGGLVGFVSWELREVERDQAALTVAAGAAALAEESSMAALRALPAERDLSAAPDRGAAEAALAEATASLAGALDLAAQAAAATPLPAARAAAEAALPELGTQLGALDEMLAIRLRVIAARDERLYPLYGEFDQAMEALLGAIEFEIEDPGAREEFRARAMAAYVGVNEVRLGVQRQLAMPDEAQARRVRRAVAQSRVHLRGMMATPTGDRLRGDVERVSSVADRLAGAAEEILAALEAGRALRDERADPAAAAALGTLHAALDALRQDAAARRLHVAEEVVQTKVVLLSLGAAVALILLLSAWVTGRAVGTPLRRVAEGVRAIAAGDARPAEGAAAALAARDAARRDEIGAIAAAVETLRESVGRAFAQQQMIEQLPLGVMTAEPRDGFRVSYVNAEMRRVLELLHRAGALPCAPEAVVGQDPGRLHAGLAEARDRLADPARLPHQARLSMGGEVLELRATAITDGAGAYQGPMLTWRVATEQARVADSFEAEVGAVVDRLAGQAESLRRSAGEVSETAQVSGREAAAVAEASGRASGEVGAVASAAEEMAASIAEITRRVGEAAEVAGRAVSEVRSTDGAVRGLSDSADRIGDVVRLIGDIAGQTNLLALNATIEAARAGEAGRGFAVVASEVKTLAAQTAKATEEISAQIAAMQSATGGAVEAIRGIGETVERTSEIATAIAAAVEEQGAVTREIARSAAQVASGTDTVSTAIGGVRRAAEAAGGAAGGMLSATEELAAQAAALREKSAAFLRSVRAT